MSGDPIGDALRADAEQARDEIRATGLFCPSCGGNAGDLYGRHCLILVTRTPVSGARGFGHAVALIGKPETWCECRDGQPASLTVTDWETWKAAANIALMDDFWFRETIAFARDVIGTGPGKFTGLLSTLEGEVTGRGESFTCANCKKACVKGRSDEEAWAEAENLFPAGDLLGEEPGTVCDPCFRMIMAWAKVNAPELLL